MRSRMSGFSIEWRRLPPLRREVWTVDRRDFLRTTMLAGAGMTLAPRATQAADARIDVLLDEPIARIDPNVYGHFVEHLGGVVYDGIWVGERSRIANTAGIRQALVDRMRRLPKGVIRWPGGCFADSYDWRDGVGPREARPRRTNFWADGMGQRPDGPWKYDPNQFGTNEFVRFVPPLRGQSLPRGQPSQPARARLLPVGRVLQLARRIDDAGRPARQGRQRRAAAGALLGRRERELGLRRQPHGGGVRGRVPQVHGVGASLRRGVVVHRIGPNGGDLSWTRRFFSNLTAKGDGALGSMWGWGLHHYSWNVSRGATTDWDAGKGDALVYTTDEWYEMLAQANLMESLITGHWAVMGEIDRRHRVKLVVDEWGTWHKPGTEVHPRTISASSPASATRWSPVSRSTRSIAMPTRSRWPTSRSS